ncbi:MAG TPA: hypothetical protein VII95_14490 [Terriglobales bacterium]|jgi:hypothetical protein
MKQLKSIIVAVTVVLAFAATAALAQGRGPGMGMPNYDPKTEVTVKGTIEDIQQQQGRHGWMGTHLVMKTDSGTLDVHVGPSGYITENHFSFAKGDAIEVIGSKVIIQDKDALLARQIIKDGKTLVLRNAQGIPEWSGSRWRNN